MFVKQKIEPGTYRIGHERIGYYIVYQAEDLTWTMGKPVDWDDPLGAGLEMGTVTYKHRTLRDCVSTARRRLRSAKYVAPCQ